MIDAPKLTIGNKIKKFRELRNFTQEFMADQLDMSTTGYGKIERDEVDVPYSRLTKIAEVLKVKVEDIVGFDEKFIFNISGQQNFGYIQPTFNINFPEKLQQLYEDKIKLLEDKIKYLENLVS